MNMTKALGLYVVLLFAPQLCASEQTSQQATFSKSELALKLAQEKLADAQRDLESMENFGSMQSRRMADNVFNDHRWNELYSQTVNNDDERKTCEQRIRNLKQKIHELGLTIADDKRKLKNSNTSNN